MVISARTLGTGLRPAPRARSQRDMTMHQQKQTSILDYMYPRSCLNIADDDMDGTAAAALETKGAPATLATPLAKANVCAAAPAPTGVQGKVLALSAALREEDVPSENDDALKIPNNTLQHDQAADDNTVDSFAQFTSPAPQAAAASVLPRDASGSDSGDDDDGSTDFLRKRRRISASAGTSASRDASAIGGVPGELGSFGSGAGVLGDHLAQATGARARKQQAFAPVSAPLDAAATTSPTPLAPGGGGNSNLVEYDAVVNMRKRGGSYACPVKGCDKTYASKRGLRHHNSAKHRNIKFACPKPGCERAFANRQVLKNHIDRYHDGKPAHKPHVCGCGKKYRSPGELAMHISSEHKHEYVVCELCGAELAEQGFVSTFALSTQAIFGNFTSRNSRSARRGRRPLPASPPGLLYSLLRGFRLSGFEPVMGTDWHLPSRFGLSTV
eukprot:CAMPEP_0206051296 /NCGR_PEP_ID=MMETSP1466-20131121/31140_1 /ASSEMBLY_ACC=CAM_ASM_001126 /TAXON_ID=44452 /ORGANISM="Pavlova gyrans, Strain CCMP608" /LENGTH=442 /DNA_ID=CAMNT_0053426421 /DNA_START=1 /DNA_END=1327 /DNA_ORIENTATION=+